MNEPKPIFGAEAKETAVVTKPTAEMMKLEEEASGDITAFLAEAGTIPNEVVGETFEIRKGIVERLLDYRKRSGKGQKHIDALFASFTLKAKQDYEKADQAKGTLKMFIEQIKGPLVKFESDVTALAKRYETQEKARRAEELDKEQKEATQRAEILEKAGDTRGADLMRDLGTKAEDRAAAPILENKDLRKDKVKYKAAVTDIVMLANAVAELQIVSDAILPNVPYLNKLSEMKKGIDPPPGVRFYQE